jgi:7-keto-8-aminopelargonate synthetase-like enzyme
VIATDSLFSMDGDLAPLGELAELKHRYDALLMIDEAHATGVLGKNGRGAAELLAVEEHVDVTVGTLSKALGALGGFVAGPAELIDTITNTARAYIYTTALPPALCAAASEALRIVQTQPQRRQRLLELAAGLRERLKAAGFDTGDSTSQIIPITIGPAAEAVRISRRLLEAGFLVPAIRPPTVPRNSSRLRVSLCAAHEMGDLERFVAGLVDSARR